MREFGGEKLLPCGGCGNNTEVGSFITGTGNVCPAGVLPNPLGGESSGPGEVNIAVKLPTTGRACIIGWPICICCFRKSMLAG